MSDPHPNSKERAVTEDDVDQAARQTRRTLENLLDVVEGRVAGKLEVSPSVPRPLCVGIDLDFLVDHKGVAIGYSHKHKDFKTHLAICDCCLLKAECLEWAVGNEFGVWGGTLPRDRVKSR